MQTQKKNPETIANLIIYWIFNQQKYRYFNDFFLNFKDKNPNLKNWKIISGKYDFRYISTFPFDIPDFSFSININYNDTLTHLMYLIHCEMEKILKLNNVEAFSLGIFRKISDNSFEITEELPF